MKDGWSYNDGKVIVSNYNINNGNVREEIEREYQDNIKDILITENIIEYLNYLKKQANVPKHIIKIIEEEILKQEELLKKLINDKRKDNEISLAHDTLKWVDDYMRLDYVDKINKLEEQIMGCSRIKKR